MALFKFGDFVFDSDLYRLERNGEVVTLRPKVLQLLCLLIENRERVVSKAEILNLIWGAAYARDHLLFQLVSELRKAPFEASFVRTKPNEGYRWNVPTHMVSSSRRPQLAQIAAGLAIGVMCVVTSYFLTGQNHSSATLVQLPAYNAFSKGIVAMESGQSDEAEEWFRFTLNENPESIEASLFLAETLLQQNRPEESSAEVYSLLSQPGLNSYTTMTATDLLSRIHQRQGQLKTALVYAQRSSQENVLAQCSIDVIDERVQFLEDQIDVPVASPHPQHPPASNIDKSEDPYQDQCQQLREESEETSYCEPSFSPEYYAFRFTTRDFYIS